MLVSVKEKESVAENELNSTPSTLENRFVICEAKDKFATLVAFLRNRFADKVSRICILACWVGNPLVFLVVFSGFAP